MPGWIDRQLDRYTMHRVTLFALLGMVAWGIVLSAAGVLGYSPLDIAGAALISVAVSAAVNAAFARVLRATSSLESTIITGLILALIIPIGLGDNRAFVVTAAAVAMASKYIATDDKQHVFNPAAFALAALALLFPDMTAGCWVGTLWMLPAVVFLGGLVMLKTRRAGVVFTFLLVYAVVATATEWIDTSSARAVGEALGRNFGQTALVFFALIMITEPITTPFGHWLRSGYVTLLALLYVTPELRFLGSYTAMVGNSDRIPRSVVRPIEPWNPPLPRISNHWLKTVFYLFPSDQDACDGTEYGGTGFFVGYPAKTLPGKWHVYAVTNRHVIEAGNTYMRLNSMTKDHHYVWNAESPWFFHPDGDDIAVYRMPGRPQFLDAAYVTLDNFLTREVVKEKDIGIGDDVFLVGRFRLAGGKLDNTPTARFGNISLMDGDKVQLESGRDVEAILIETRTIPGYSGSPVMVHILDSGHRTPEPDWDMRGGPWLLGIEWGTIPQEVPVRDAAGNEIPLDWRVRENTGMAAVAPAWKIREVLDLEELKNEREKSEAATRKNDPRPHVEPTSFERSEPPDREKFYENLRRASRRTSEPDSSSE